MPARRPNTRSCVRPPLPVPLEQLPPNYRLGPTAFGRAVGLSENRTNGRIARGSKHLPPIHTDPYGGIFFLAHEVRAWLARCPGDLEFYPQKAAEKARAAAVQATRMSAPDANANPPDSSLPLPSAPEAPLAPLAEVP